MRWEPELRVAVAPVQLVVVQPCERDLLRSDVTTWLSLLEQPQMREQAKERWPVKELLQSVPAVCPPGWLVVMHQLQPVALRAQELMDDLAAEPRELV